MPTVCIQFSLKQCAKRYVRKKKIQNKTKINLLPYFDLALLSIS